MNANESNSPLIFVVVVVVRKGVVALHKNFLENGTAPIFQFHGSLALSPGRKSPGKNNWLPSNLSELCCCGNK